MNYNIWLNKEEENTLPNPISDFLNEVKIGYMEFFFSMKKEIRNSALNELLGFDEEENEQFSNQKIQIEGSKNVFMSIQEFLKINYKEIIGNNSFYYINFKNQLGEKVSLKIKILFYDIHNNREFNLTYLKEYEDNTLLHINQALKSETFYFDFNDVYSKIIFIDNIKEKKIEEKAKLFDYQFRGTFEKANIGMAIVSIDGKIIDANYSFCHFLGLNNLEIKEITFQEITHPEDLINDLKHLQSCLEGETDSYTIEKRYFHKNGNTIWGRLTATLIKDVNNEPLYFISHIEDITDLKINLKLLNEANFELKSIINANPNVLVYTTNLSGEFKNINQGLTNITHFDVDDVFDKSPIFFFEKIKFINNINLYKNDINLTTIQNNIIESFEELKSIVLKNGSAKFIAELKTRDFDKLQVELMVSPIKNEREETIGLVFIAFDITKLFE